MQGNARGTYGSGCKEPGEYRRIPGELMGVGAKCHGNAGEYRGMSGERMSGCKLPGECRECRGMPGERCIVPGECRGLPGECKRVGVKC